MTTGDPIPDYLEMLAAQEELIFATLMVIQALRAASPDIHYHIEAEVAKGEMLTQYLTAHG